MKITVQPNTNPIAAGAVAPKAFSFASGGGGGGGAVTIYPVYINTDGAQNQLSLPVPLATEVELTSFNLTLLGGKKALMLAFSAITNLVGPAPEYLFKLYVNGVVVSQVRGTIEQTFHWGFLIASTVVGLTPMKLTVENIGGATFNAGPSTYMGMEFEQ
jgi:hypothetical protein